MESDDENLVINPENLNLSDEGSDDDGDRIFGSNDKNRQDTTIQSMKLLSLGLFF